MRFLLVWPSASFSIFDCATGIRSGLLAEGHQIHDYRLYRRIMLISSALKLEAPEGEQPDFEEASLHASEAIPYAAITNNTRWALVVSGMGLHPNALMALRRIGVKIALWATEGPYQADPEHELYLAQFADLLFTNERTCVNDFQRTLDETGNGGQAVYLPHAYNPEVHHPEAADPEQTCDVLLIGTGFAERQQLLEAIDWTGIDLKLGGLWTGIKPPAYLHEKLKYPCLDNRDTIRLYHGAKVVINPHRWHPTAESANPRTYEVAACGAFQISDYRAETAELFGKSVPTYVPGVPWQLATMIRRYLADDAKRAELAAEAQRRVQPHTFQARAKTIVDAIGQYERQRVRKLVALPSLRQEVR